jgi:hypothetical protein
MHEEDETVTLTPALSHPMGEGDLVFRADVQFHEFGVR